MELEKAKELTLSLMAKHNLQGWRMDFDRAKRRLGCCRHSLKKITLSKEYVLLNDEKRVRNTILHEIAHALVGCNHGHDVVWQQKAISIGCDGKRLASNVVSPKAKYVATCPICGTKIYRNRKTKKIFACRHCYGEYGSKAIFHFVLNE